MSVDVLMEPRSSGRKSQRSQAQDKVFLDLVSEAESTSDADSDYDVSSDELTGPRVHISQMNITDPEEAAYIARKIIRAVEADVGERMAEIEAKEAAAAAALVASASSSDLSIGSQFSIPPAEAPSQVAMWYEKGENPQRGQELTKMTEGVDVEAEAELHRHKKWKHGRPTVSHKETQTKIMTFVPDTRARHIFLTMYPRPDDYVAPPSPKRKYSMNKVIEEARKRAEEAAKNPKEKDPLVDVKHFSNRKRILPPVTEEAFKEETYWTGSKFVGEFRNNQFYHGHYDHPTGVEYESEWKEGHFHTRKHLGAVVYPRGDMFEGKWKEGRYTSGHIVFGDGLRHSSGPGWAYCDGKDRRFRFEKDYGMRPAGDTVYNDQYPNIVLKPGHYDVGEGTYDIKTGEVRGYDGYLIRLVNKPEHNWIVHHCRKALFPEDQYIPTFNPDRLPGAYEEQAKRFTVAKRKFH